MTPEQVQEEISKAYVHAVAAKCGFAVGSWSQDHGCVDATLGAGNAIGGGTFARPKLDVQLKATTRRDIEHHDHIAWSLEVEHYDHLRAKSTVPLLLVILLLADTVDASIEHTVDRLMIRKCAYWTHLEDRQAAPDGRKSVTVHVPKENVFSPNHLLAIMDRISKGQNP